MNYLSILYFVDRKLYSCIEVEILVIIHTQLNGEHCVGRHNHKTNNALEKSFSHVLLGSGLIFHSWKRFVHKALVIQTNDKKNLDYFLWIYCFAEAAIFWLKGIFQLDTVYIDSVYCTHFNTNTAHNNGDKRASQIPCQANRKVSITIRQEGTLLWTNRSLSL